MSDKLLTAVVCTLNRLGDLKECLAELDKEQEKSKGRLEILVVDNGSTDGTLEFLNEWRGFGRCLAEENEKGLSVARNTGLSLTSTKWIAYLDDDAMVHSGWFEAFEKAVDEIRGLRAGGGRITLRWPDIQPKWVREEDLPYYSMLELGEDRRELGYDEMPVGANMFFQCEMLKKAGGFQVEFSRIGDGLISGDESDVIRKMQAEGLILHYLPKMSIDHVIPPARAEKAWLKRRKIAAGISQIRMDFKFDKIQRGNLRRLLFEWKRWFFAFMTADTGNAWIYRGRFTEYLRKWK